MTTDLPALLERCWLTAPPGREAVCQNEFMRALLIEPRPEPPRSASM
jgi:hypothetical protein